MNPRVGMPSDKAVQGQTRAVLGDSPKCLPRTVPLYLHLNDDKIKRGARLVTQVCHLFVDPIKHLQRHTPPRSNASAQSKMPFCLPARHVGCQNRNRDNAASLGPDGLSQDRVAAVLFRDRTEPFRKHVVSIKNRLTTSNSATRHCSNIGAESEAVLKQSFEPDRSLVTGRTFS